jgi:23S rRNA pseudouridine2605 synthase
VRLSKALAGAGVASRRKAESLVRAGRVTVNGHLILEPGTPVDPHRDHIKVEGRFIRAPAPLIYILLNKPKGVMTTLHDPQGRTTVKDLLKGVKTRLFPVGRLDYHTEGILLLTNDGELAQSLLHPRYGVERAYLAKVKGVPTPEDLERMRRGVCIQKGIVARAQAEIHRVLKKNAWLELVLREGRHREVRRMCRAVGYPVLSLKRTRFGPLTTGRLAPGQYRALTEAEIRRLKRFADSRKAAKESK